VKSKVDKENSVVLSFLAITRDAGGSDDKEITFL
jgi:hypothetical protein